MIINFIRHGRTVGNLTKKYIGRTDEPLCADGINELGRINYPECDIVAVSPMKRCIETAGIIYPDKKTAVFRDFRECDFGDFEGRNYIELSGNSDYQKWIDSGGKLPFPNGESVDGFKKRCVSAFCEMTEMYSGLSAVSMVVHGGTIMSVLEKYAYPQKDYYSYSAENGHGFITEFKNGKIAIIDYI